MNLTHFIVSTMLALFCVVKLPDPEDLGVEVRQLKSNHKVVIVDVFGQPVDTKSIRLTCKSIGYISTLKSFEVKEEARPP